MNAWHTSGGGNHRNGLASAAVNHQSNSPITIQAKGGVVASPIIAEDGTAFIADRAGYIQAISAEGNSIWDKKISEGFHASPALNEDGSVLFVASVAGNVMAVNTKDGSIKWKEPIIKNNDPRLLSDVLFLPKRN